MIKRPVVNAVFIPIEKYKKGIMAIPTQVINDITRSR